MSLPETNRVYATNLAPCCGRCGESLLVGMRHQCRGHITPPPSEGDRIAPQRATSPSELQPLADVVYGTVNDRPAVWTSTSALIQHTLGLLEAQQQTIREMRRRQREAAAERSAVALERIADAFDNPKAGPHGPRTPHA